MFHAHGPSCQPFCWNKYIQLSVHQPTYPATNLITYVLFYQTTILANFEMKSKLTNIILPFVAEFEHMFSCFLYCQTSTSAVLQLESVMSMPTVRILLVLIFVRAKLDTVEMGKHAKVDKRNVYWIMRSATMSSTLLNQVIVFYER